MRTLSHSHRQRGQSTVEYIVLIVILLAAMLTMQVYIKRGISGRWKTVADDLGEQYDPRMANGIIRQTIKGTSNSIIQATQATINGVSGKYSMRYDASLYNETKTGSLQVGN